MLVNVCWQELVQKPQAHYSIIDLSPAFVVYACDKNYLPVMRTKMENMFTSNSLITDVYGQLLVHHPMLCYVKAIFL